MKIKACKASSVIRRLTELIKTHGDLPVYLNDPDTGWFAPIGIVFDAGSATTRWEKQNKLEDIFLIESEPCSDSEPEG